MDYDYIKQGDCLKLMKEIPDKSIDLIIADPPYGINYQSQWIKNKEKRKPKIMNDRKPFTEFITELPRIISDSGAVMIFTRWDVQQIFIDAMVENRMKPKNILIWDKVVHGMGDLKRAYGSRYESILFWSNKSFRFNGKRPTDILCVQRVSPNNLLHPNEKPIKLIEMLIDKATVPESIILDPFIGSGTTAVAAINTNRHYIGFELDEKYFDIACKRLDEVENHDFL